MNEPPTHSRRHWLVSLYGPGAITIAFGFVVAFSGVVVGEGSVVILGGVMVALGVALLMAARSALYLYRYGYFKGRADQLVDVERGVRRGRLDPWPWDRVQDWPT